MKPHPLNLLAIFCALLLTRTIVASAEPADIVLGMSTALSGPMETLGNEMRQGVTAGLERANRAGGVRDQRLRLIVLDDGYEAVRTAGNMLQLVEKEKVLAVIGNVGTQTAASALPIVREIFRCGHASARTSSAAAVNLSASSTLATRARSCSSNSCSFSGRLRLLRGFAPHHCLACLRD